MVFYESDFAPAVPLSHARIGYDNRVTTATADSALPDFPAASVANPLTYEFWRPVGTSGVLTALFNAGPVDYVGIASHTLKDALVRVEALVGGVWTFINLVQINSNNPCMFLFSEVQAAGVRLTVTGAPGTSPSIGVLYAGKALAMQRMVWGGINPINFTRRTAIRPNVSEGGQWLGRSIIREGSETSVTWRNLSYDWYKSDFDPFVAAARTRPFFFAMRPDKYPEISGYVWTAEDITPTISGVRTYLDTTVGMEGLELESAPDYEAFFPTLSLNFARDRNLDPRITFTRASTATFFDQNGVLQTAPANTARFDHNPVTGESLGLLIEEQRTNLLLNSGNLASINLNNAVRLANQLIAPDGTLTGSILTGAGNGLTSVTQSATATATTMTFSCFVKVGLPSTRTSYQFFIRNSTTGTNFTVGSFSTATGGITGSGWTSTHVGNNWYRISYTNTSTEIIDVGNIVVSYFGSTGGAVYATTDHLGVWGAQLEAGVFPTSYIPTGASQVTRSADVATMTGANFSSWYRADEGTLYGDARIYATTATGPVLFGISDGTTNNAFYGGQTIPSQVRPLGVRANSADQAFRFVSLTVPVNYSYKFAGAYRTNSIGGAVNGTAVAEVTTALIPQVNQAAIGALTATIQRFSGHIRKLAYYPARLTNAALVALTS